MPYFSCRIVAVSINVLNASGVDILSGRISTVSDGGSASHQVFDEVCQRSEVSPVSRVYSHLLYMIYIPL